MLQVRSNDRRIKECKERLSLSITTHEYPEAATTSVVPDFKPSVYRLSLTIRKVIVVVRTHAFVRR